MKKPTTLFKFVLLSIMSLFFLNSQAQWTLLESDPTGDGFDSLLLDGTEMSYRYDDVADSLWFQFILAGISPQQSTNLGVNIMVNYPGGGNTFSFWSGASVNPNNGPFHKLVTAWVTGTPPSSYTGDIGIGDAAGIGGGNYTNLFSNNLTIQVDQVASMIIIGMNRSDLIPDTAMGQPILVAGAVGSSVSWNDDIYSANSFMTLSPVGINESKFSNSIKIGPSPSDGIVSISSSLASGQDYSVRVTNVLGRLVMEINSTDLATGTSVIDLSKYDNGVYTITVKSGNEFISKNVVLAK